MALQCRHRTRPQLWLWLLSFLSLAFCCTLTAAPAPTSQTPDDCRLLNDDQQRLACYDQVFPRLEVNHNSAQLPASQTAMQIASQTATPTAANQSLTAIEPSLEVATVLDKFWELTRAEKRERFVFRSYQANFFLPLHYSSNLNRQPQSPGKQPAPANDNYRQLESKLQLSLRTKIVTDLLWQDADLWFAFTQRSMWQLWNSQDSAPFRNTDYQPELIYILPLAKKFGTLPWGWRVRMLQAGIAHQSNGQSDPLSRSWNKISFGMALDKNEFGLNWRYHQRLPESVIADDNPDLIDYIGSHELTATWLPGLSTASLIWRNDGRHLNQGSWQLDMTYPFTSEKMDGLRWHLQLFSGYGETLLDYNHRQHSIGLGVMLFNF